MSETFIKHLTRTSSARESYLARNQVKNGDLVRENSISLDAINKGMSFIDEELRLELTTVYCKYSNIEP